MSRFICLNCYYYGFASDDDYFAHLYLKTCYKTYTCGGCNEIFDTKMLVDEHLSICTLKKISVESKDLLTNCNYIYVIKEREFVNSGESIYKIGRTKRGHSKRTNEYPKSSIVMFVAKVPDEKLYESAVLDYLRQVSKERKDIGSEYFEDNFDDIFRYVSETINKLNKRYAVVITNKSPKLCLNANIKIFKICEYVAMRSSDMIYYLQYLENLCRSRFDELINSIINAYNENNLIYAIKIMISIAHNTSNHTTLHPLIENLRCCKVNKSYKFFIRDYRHPIKSTMTRIGTCYSYKNKGDWYESCDKNIAQIISNEFRYINTRIQDLKKMTDDDFEKSYKIRNRVEMLYDNEECIKILTICAFNCSKYYKGFNYYGDNSDFTLDTQFSHAIQISKYFTH